MNIDQKNHGESPNPSNLQLGAKAVAALGVATTCLINANDVSADIVYSGPMNIVLTPGSYINPNPGYYDPDANLFLDFDNDGDNDLILQVRTGGNGSNTSFDADGIFGFGRVFGATSSNNYANMFEAGDLVPGVADTAGGAGWMGWYRAEMGIDSDPWGALQAGVNGTGPVNGFLGIRVDSGELNGWIQLSLEANAVGQPVTMTVIDWAYEDSGLEIAAGDTGEKTSLPGDVNCDGVVNLLDVAPFVDLIINGGFSGKADLNGDGVVDLLDVQPFVNILTGG